MSIELDERTITAIAHASARVSMRTLSSLIDLVANADSAKKALAILEEVKRREAQLIADRKAFEEDCGRALARIEEDRERVAQRMAEIADERNHPGLIADRNELLRRIAARAANASAANAN